MNVGRTYSRSRMYEANRILTWRVVDGAWLSALMFTYRDGVLAQRANLLYET
jgi:restriction endonuclease Mrr